jgi:hypothetical protein
MIVTLEVSNATSSMIKDIVSPESIQPGEKMMALNVVYFKGQKKYKKPNSFQGVLKMVFFIQVTLPIFLSIESKSKKTGEVFMLCRICSF